MRVKNLIAGVGAATLLACGSAEATSISWATSGVNPLGNAAAFDGSAFASVEEAVWAAHTGSGVFSGVGAADDTVNVFVVDFTGGSAASAGVTLIVNWGNSATVDPFEANVTFTPSLTDGGDIDVAAVPSTITTGGSPTIYTYGGASIVAQGSLSTFGAAEDPVPTGFAITNFGADDFDAVQIDFTAFAGSISDWALIDANLLGPVVGSSGSNGDAGNTLAMTIPLPAPVWMGLAGLAGVLVLRRRVC